MLQGEVQGLENMREGPHVGCDLSEEGILTCLTTNVYMNTNHVKSGGGHVR